MWGGIYAVLFSISTIMSTENPVKNGFPNVFTHPYEKITSSMVNFKIELLVVSCSIHIILIEGMVLSNQVTLFQQLIKEVFGWVQDSSEK